MLRITELRLPLDHGPDDLLPAVLTRLGLAEAELSSLVVFKRSHDARKKSAVVLIYTIDCTLAAGVDEAGLLARHAGDSHVRPTPDTRYHLVAQAPVGFELDRLRPVVIGFGPCAAKRYANAPRTPGRCGAKAC